ncbi:hypothetical protein OROHE_003413 [Orobanche hederae]
MAPNKKKVNEESEVAIARANWSKETLKIFCDICIGNAERSKGKRGATISQRMPWKLLEIEFQKKTNLIYDKNKLKNKWDWMKNRWSLWKALKGKETGLGWDHEKGTISASEEWWKNKIEENIQFKAFQDEGIEPELEMKMEQLFGVSVAQRVLKFTPAQQKNEALYNFSPPPNINHCNTSFDYDEDMNEDDILNHTQTNKEWHEVWNDNDASHISHSSQFIEPGVTRRGSKRVSHEDLSQSSKSCRNETSKKGGAGMLIEKLDAMVKIVTERNHKDMELMNLETRTLGDSSISLADSLAKLAYMPGLLPGSLEFCFACTLIEDPQKRIILEGIPDDNARLQWIKYLYEKSEKNE